MRVWLINHYGLPPSEPGWTRHYALARELIRSGHDVTLITSSFNHVTGMQMNCAGEKLCTFERFGRVPFGYCVFHPIAARQRGCGTCLFSHSKYGQA